MRRAADRDRAVPFTVLIVDTRSGAAARIGKILSEAGYVVTIASSFQDAKQELDRMPPDVLITDVRLGAYNGLHLVVRTRARSPTTAAIVTHGTHDPVLEAEATSQQAIYLVRPLAPRRLLRIVGRLLEWRTTPAMGIEARRWRRKEVAERFVVKVGESQAQVIDVSYGGLRLEMETRTRPVNPQPIEWPHAGVVFFGWSIWMRPGRREGSWWYGIRLDETDSETGEAWRALVDVVS
jgi:DNA-binding response OmpR family regulator